ncbi:MAG: nucleotidyltransferase family protein [Cyclobacteriaceae bacterium]
MISEVQKKIILEHTNRIKPLRVGVFGSYSRGDNRVGSDLDILIHLDYSQKISLLTLASIQADLAEALGMKVDLVTEASLSPYLRPYIEKDVQYIL